MKQNTTRRNFLLASAAMAGTIACGSVVERQSQQVSASVPTQAMPERIFGKTGVSLPILGLGGAGQTPLSSPQKEKEAIALVEAALSLGIRYFDTAADYGPSEKYMGKVLPSHRDKIFLASKTAARDRDGAWKDLERSLKRLNTDRLELWQLHHVSFDEELDPIFGDGGAAKALEEAKEQKIIQFTGITGHHEPDVIAAGLERYPFDMALISLNAADVHHPRPFAPVVLPVAQKHNVGIVAMKVPAYGRLFKPGVLKGMEQAMGYVLSLAGVHNCIIAAENVEQLQANVRVAQAFQPLAQADMAKIEQLTASVWEDNTFFRQWT
ncbi:aldo/keto reductase [Candidatus Gracilibacteria bacterium]|nr:aldo/keto reductase [Candidatus Gracilibacteria bacterium]NJM88039.1 aldo/keto reductase [Hydrococcus sp. RU_2_2]NJP19519.1 aldo/keto reductase [Hydrococcus sp. CRU_1_1]